MAIDYKKFIHPEDRAAMENLKKIPGLESLTRAYLKHITEDLQHGENLANRVRLSHTQLPRIYRLLEEVCGELQIKIPELYLEMNPIPNAYTSGDTNPFVVVNSGIIDLLKEDELKAVIAHECGHILCHHVLYHQLADFLISAGGGVAGLFGAGIITEPLKVALFYWVRRSEFSADRVSAYVMKNSDATVRTMLRLAGGPAKLTDELNIDEFLAQADEYHKFINGSSKSDLLQNLSIMDNTHPYNVIRAAEVVKWFNKSQDCIPGIAHKQDALTSSLNW